MAILTNLFVTSGYVSSGYFCDWQTESEQLIREISNGNNLALLSTRRMGKSGLIEHCFGNESIACPYYILNILIRKCCTGCLRNRKNC